MPSKCSPFEIPASLEEKVLSEARKKQKKLTRLIPTGSRVRVTLWGYEVLFWYPVRKSDLIQILHEDLS